VEHREELLNEALRLQEGWADLAKGGQILSFEVIKSLRVTRHPSQTAVVAENF
jgi:hypothetical protein